MKGIGILGCTGPHPRLTHPRADVPFDAVDDAERCVSYLSDQADLVATCG